MPRRAAARRSQVPKAQPAFHAGTSSEYDGKRPLPQVIRQRPIMFVLGPAGVGKTKVALRLAQPRYAFYERDQIEQEVAGRLAQRAWSPEIRQTPAVVLEVPFWLDQRPGMCRMIVDLLHERAADGLRTIVCQPPDVRTVDQLLGELDPGRIVLIGLRFPQGRRGRRRVALRMCEARGIDPDAARGTEVLEPWTYARVLAQLEEWQRTHELEPRQSSGSAR